MEAVMWAIMIGPSLMLCGIFAIICFTKRQELLRLWKRIFRTDFRVRLLVTVLLSIPFFLCSSIPLPGLDTTALRAKLADVNDNTWRPLAVAELGLWPYISANLLLLLVSTVWQKIRRRSVLSAVLRSNIRVYALIVTILICLVQAWFLGSTLLDARVMKASGLLVTMPRFAFLLSSSLCLTLGTLLLLLISRGIGRLGLGHGVSVLILLTSFLWDFGLPATAVMLWSPHKENIMPLIICVSISIGLFLLAIRTLRLTKTIAVEDIETLRGGKSDLPVSLNGFIPGIVASAVPLVVLNLRGSLPSEIVLCFLEIAAMILGSWCYYGIPFSAKTAEERLGQSGLRIAGGKPGEKVLRDALFRNALLWGGIASVFLYAVPALSSIFNLPFSMFNLPYLLLPATVIGLKEAHRRRSGQVVQVFTHTDPVEIFCARSYLAARGISSATHSAEAFGILEGFFIGPLAERMVVVSKEDYPKAIDFVEEFKLCRAEYQDAARIHPRTEC